MTNFTLEGFVAKLAELMVAVHEAEHATLERAAMVVERAAKAEIAHFGDGRDLHDSIEHMLTGREAYIGSNSEVAEYQELGTSRIPPRSFLGSALASTTEEVAKVVSESVVDALTGRHLVGGTQPVIRD